MHYISGTGPYAYGQESELQLIDVEWDEVTLTLRDGSLNYKLQKVVTGILTDTWVFRISV
jgi:hypothetical protein